MKTASFFAAIVMVAACAKSGPKTQSFPGRQLGESTASPGSNPSKPQPLTPDDPRVMNVSAGISPAQAQAAAQAPLPTTMTAPVTAPTTAPVTPGTQAQPAPSSQTVRAPSAPNPATSSTPVTQPTDIAPATTTPDDANRPGVFSPPPPPPQ
jgi:hypothetical protein